MSSSEMAKLLELVRVLRLNSESRVGLLSVECLLLVAGGPKTSAELVAATGSANGLVIRALWPFLTRMTREGQVIPAQIPLLKMVKRPRKTPSYHLSVNGWRLLRDVGLM